MVAFLGQMGHSRENQTDGTRSKVMFTLKALFISQL